MNISHLLTTTWERLKTSIWFIPMFMSLCAIVLASMMLRLDRGFTELPWDWLSYFRIGADGVRQIFVVTTSSMITITGVTFSITIVALTLASNQFGPKILRNYLRNTPNKVVLGLLIATFVYGLVVLVFIEDDGYVPLFATLVNLLLTAFSVAGVIYFIHSITSSIQADNVIALIAEDLDDSIKNLDRKGVASEENHTEYWQVLSRNQAQLIECSNKGYVQFIDYESLLAIAEKYGGHFNVCVRAGDFLISGLKPIEYYGGDELEQKDCEEIGMTVGLGQQRIPSQDLEFSIEQLVQVALRALSPGVNDSYTAITCIDWISASIGKMTSKEFPSRWICDHDGVPRVQLMHFSFAGSVRAAYNPLRQNARNNEMVIIRLLDSIGSVMKVTKDKQRMQVLFEQAEAIQLSAMEDINRGIDRNAIENRFDICKNLNV